MAANEWKFSREVQASFIFPSLYSTWYYRIAITKWIQSQEHENKKGSVGDRDTHRVLEKSDGVETQQSPRRSSPLWIPFYRMFPADAYPPCFRFVQPLSTTRGRGTRHDATWRDREKSGTPIDRRNLVWLAVIQPRAQNVHKRALTRTCGTCTSSTGVSAWTPDTDIDHLERGGQRGCSWVEWAAVVRQDIGTRRSRADRRCLRAQ